MRYFKAPSPKSKSMMEARAVLGDAGLWQIACLVEEAQLQDIWELDIETIVGWIKVKRDRAEKILPFAQKIFEECSEIFSKSPKIFSKSQKISSKSKDFTPSNPHGSTRDQIEKEEEKEEEKVVVVNSENEKPKHNNGCFFKIKRPFETVGEEDWIRRQVIENLRYKHKKTVNDSLSMHELSVLYGGVNKLTHAWLSNPIEQRMAAFAYTANQPAVDGELIYATAAIRDSYEGYLKLVPQMVENVKNNDYEVEIS